MIYIYVYIWKIGKLLVDIKICSIKKKSTSKGKEKGEEEEEGKSRKENW